MRVVVYHKVACLVAALISIGLLVNTAMATEEVVASGCSYDGRSLVINGKRELVFSGSIHYTRSQPDMWPDLLKKSREGGLNAISTYVFWNVHEPEPGKFDFSGQNDLAQFIKLAQKNGMFVILRVGPFIQAEWNHGGLPYWLREVPDMTFRTNNEPFKRHMEKFVSKVVDEMNKDKLFASQGGPIILFQIENEYNNVAATFKEEGTKYIHWAANMALNLSTGVPVIMCKQNDAPGAVIPTCNGRNCGDTYVPVHSAKPILWTENWTAQYRVFGDPPSQRSAEDLAFSVARFFARSGTMINYYMYHGGTNYGRTGAAFVTTRYYDEAPLDEYGLYKEPKWGHLKDLHHTLRLCRKGLLWGKSSVHSIGKDFEVRVYEKPDENICVAFLANANPKVDGSINFRGTSYYLPRHSISILPDCKTVVYNTQKVNAQHNARTFIVAKQTQQGNEWMMNQEPVPRYRETAVKAMEPLELFNMTKDRTDYLWYSTSFKIEDDDLPIRHDIRPVLQVSNLGHVMHAFVNGQYIGTGRGTKIEKSFVFQKPMELKTGLNHISLLNMMVGLPDSGAYMERRMAGVHTASIQGLNTGTLDLTTIGWGHQVGLAGEFFKIYEEEGISKVRWAPAVKNMPVTWYRRYFDAPEGTDPVALDLSSMGKGFMYVNGKPLGRYWVSYLSPLGKPSQSVYHMPRSFLKPKNNYLVIFEEHTGNPKDILIMTVKRDNICTFVSEQNPALSKSWSRKDGQLKTKGDDLSPAATLTCPDKKIINKVVFASFGNPLGMCGNFTAGSCHTPKAISLVEKLCVGKKSCTLPATGKDYDADAKCPGTASTLAVQAKCVKNKDKENN
ncbi:Beta-galactosidase [Rhynchospora pubera]|uniref:Beta-galactosidase n=1 Tax=Rhynchospora pubera TaxID=906938 RepID=A0AAV8GJ64_9POAL|nr:Beta-galactosidase [Rhynchospora pubera]